MMKKLCLIFLMISFSASSGFSQIILLNEDFGAEGSYASSSLEPLASYDLDPVATYLSTESVAINYYGQDNTSDTAYDGASGGNFFLLSNNWNESGVTLTWANMDISQYSELSIIESGVAFSGGPNAAWTGSWLFSLEYSFDDVVNDPDNATWHAIDLTEKASGWPDPQVAGGDNWSKVVVEAGINLLGEDTLAVRIKSNGNFDYHFDDFKLTVKTPITGMERISIAKETFGPGTFYRGPANEYENYSNAGKLSFNDYQVHYQNYGNTFDFSYAGNSNDGNWWISDDDADGVPEDTLVFSVSTNEYADIQLQFGFTYWGGTPGAMVGVYYTTDSITWYPVTTVSPTTPYPGTNQEKLSDGYFHLIKYDDLLPRSENLTIKIYQATAAQFIMDDIELTGVYQPLSADASLSEISFPDNPDLNLDPEFDRETFTYTVILPEETIETPVVEAMPTDTAADYIVENALDVTSEDEADRQTYIYVTASDEETTLLYTLTFNVAKSSDASITELSINGNPVEDFSPDDTGYDFILPSDATEVPEVQYTKGNEDATVEISEATELPGSTIITVTAEDGVTTSEYRINFLLAPVGINDDLDGIEIYPVPATKALNVNSPTIITGLRISDITGKIIYQQKGMSDKSLTISIDAFDKGVYFLEITDRLRNMEILRFLKL